MEEESPFRKEVCPVATDKMYELALRYSNAKLWDLMYDDEPFAVQLSDGEIGYCSVMGRMGDHYALGLYVGDEGYQSYRQILDTDFDALDDAAMSHLKASQSCLICSFEDKELLSPPELAEVKRFSEAHGKRIRGRNAYPQFLKHSPGRMPWPFDFSALDEQRICQALEAAIALKRMLRQHSPEELGFRSMQEDPAAVPLLVYEQGRWVVKYTPLPSAEIVYPAPEFDNEVLAAHLRRKQKNGGWECGTARLPRPVRAEEHELEAPYFPFVLIAVDLESGYMLQPVVTDGDDAGEIVNGFAQLLMEGTAPESIFCAEERCFWLLEDFCAKAGIELVKVGKTVLLSDAVSDLLDHMATYDEDPEQMEMEQLLDTLIQMDDHELRELPQELIDMLFSLAATNALPEALSSRIKRLFRAKQ